MFSLICYRNFGSTFRYVMACISVRNCYCSTLVLECSATFPTLIYTTAFSQVLLSAPFANHVGFIAIKSFLQHELLTPLVVAHATSPNTHQHNPSRVFLLQGFLSSRCTTSPSGNRNQAVHRHARRQAGRPAACMQAVGVCASGGASHHLDEQIR